MLAWGFAARAGILLAILVISGCTSSALSDAVNLSKQGQAAASAAQQSAIVSSQEFSAYEDADTFLHGFVGATASSKSDEISNQAELAGRAKVFSSLASLYVSFGNLAAYGASTAIQGDISNVFTNVDAYQKAVEGPQINSTAAKLVPPTIGALTGLAQKEMVLAANDQIRLQLVNVINVMSDPVFQQQMLETKKLIVAEMTGNARLLLQRGLLSPKPYFDAMGQPLGLTASDDLATVLKNDKLANAGLQAVVQSHSTEAIDSVTASYKASLSALNALLPLHDKLKAGQPIGPTEIDQAVQRLQTIVAGTAPAATTNGAAK